MSIYVKGQVNLQEQRYFNSNNFGNLQVRVYPVTIDGAGDTAIATININSNGEFEKNIDIESSHIVLKLCYTGEPEKVVAVSQNFCDYDEVCVDFDYDPSSVGNSIFDTVQAGISANIGSAVLENLTEEQITNLSCLSNASEQTIRIFMDINKAWNDLLDLTEPDPSPYHTAWVTVQSFIQNEATTKKLLFVLIKEKSYENLAKLFTISINDLSESLAESVAANEINASINSEASKNFVAACRNILLFNSLADGQFYDAKLIHLSEIDGYAAKAAIMEQVMEAGSLNAIINYDDPSQNSTDLNKVIPLIGLSEHLENHAPFLAKLLPEIDELYPIDYYELTLQGASFFEDLMTVAADRPSNYETYADYAQAIFASLASAYPSAGFSSLLADSTIPSAEAISTVLNDNPDFNISGQSVHMYFNTGLPDSVNINTAVFSQMQALQRSIRLTGDITDLTATELLFENNLTNSFAITELGQQSFVNLMTGVDEEGEGSPGDEGTIIRVIEPQSAVNIFERASATVVTLNSSAVTFTLNKNGLVPRVLDVMIEYGRGNPEEPGNNVIHGPDISEIFGSFDTCSCNECQSIYSAAAYLTDMLNWLKKDVNAWAPFTKTLNCLEKSVNGIPGNFTPTQFDRRRDIRYINLTCENTNTLVPYIDLVNEILSVYLLKDTPGYGGDAALINDMITLQSVKTEEEILIEPEHRFHAAENLLKSAYFPWTLPYDVAYDESRSYLEAMGSPLNSLMLHLSADADKYNSDIWARAYLNINSDEVSVICSSHSGGTFWKDYYGVATPPPSSGGLIKVDFVLDATGLTIDELKEILDNASYINGTTKITFIAPEENPCNVSDYTFSVFSDVIADRLMRFIRLKKKTGLSTVELDLAIKNLSPSNGITAAFVKQLASRLCFAREHGLNFIETELWFGNEIYANLMNASSPSEYYKTKFYNTLLPQAIISFFTPPSSITFGTLTNEQKGYIGTVFKTDIPTIDAVINLSGAISSGDGLFTKLHVLQNYILFIQTFKIDIAQLQKILTLIGNPLAASITAADRAKAMWNFKQKYSDFSNLGIDLETLNTISTGAFIDLNEEAEEFWNKIEDAFQKALQANPDRQYNTSVPATPVLQADADFFKDVVTNAIEHELKFGFANTTKLIEEYSSTWLDDFISIPATTRDITWAISTPLEIRKIYKFFKRVSVFKQLFGISEVGLKSILDIYYAVAPASPLSDTPYYWLDNNGTYGNLTDTNITDLIWLKKVINTAAKLDISQSRVAAERGMFYYLEHYFSNAASYVAPPTSNNPILALYDNIGGGSLWKSVSVDKFTNLFLKAKIKSSSSTDLILLLEKLEEIYNATLNNSLDIDDAWSWVWNSAGTTPITYTYTISADIRRAYENRFSSRAAWSDAIVPVQDELRTSLRNALVAYHIGKKGFDDSNALYNYYLIDTQMEACMKTSRIVAAISAIQLLMHRAMVGREPFVKFVASSTNNTKKEWEWRKNYQVWVANRKVFLYPENWIDPSLRIDKTPFFKDFEGTIIQDEITDENCQQAYATYLTELNEVSRLDIRGVYEEFADDKKTIIYSHVIGRTWNPPYKYFYRKYAVADGRWTGWELIDVELDSEHVMPMVYNQKLYLFFTVFVEKASRRYADTTGFKYGYMDDYLWIEGRLCERKTEGKYYEISLGYTKLDFGKWSAKKILNGKVWAGQYTSKDFKMNDTGLDHRVGFMPPNWDGRYGQFTVSKVTTLVTPVSMNKDDFYFSPQLDSDGNLFMNVRRSYRTVFPQETDNYGKSVNNLFAYEWRYRINVADEKVEVIEPSIVGGVWIGTPYYIARPTQTLPFSQQMRSNNTVSKLPTGVYIKPTQNPSITAADNYKIMNNASNNSANKYVLTYPAQYEHSLSTCPFFFADNQNSLFFSNVIQSNGLPLPNKYKAFTNQHPYVHDMLVALNKRGVEGLLNPPQSNPINTGLKRQQTKVPFFNTYNPISNYITNTSATAAPVKEFDFSPAGPYSIYNWEVFFHSLSLIIRQLRTNNKFDEAIRWLNFIFDPADVEADHAHKKEYWQTKPFFKDVSDQSIQNMMRLLSQSSGLTSAETALKNDYINQINVWRRNPFDPHVIAGLRPRAYMLWVVMEYITTLTDWGDYLFRQDTMESINEAMNLYIMASELLGKRPKKITKESTVVRNFNDIQANLNAFSNAMSVLENHVTTLPLLSLPMSVSMGNS